MLKSGRGQPSEQAQAAQRRKTKQECEDGMSPALLLLTAIIARASVARVASLSLSSPRGLGGSLSLSLSLSLFVHSGMCSSLITLKELRGQGRVVIKHVLYRLNGAGVLYYFFCSKDGITCGGNTF